MNVLLTGCAGFIGWKVASALVDAEHRVVGVDLLAPGDDLGLKEWRLAQLAAQQGFTFRRLDLRDHGALDALPRSHGFDAVIHLAARTGVRQSLTDPRAYYETNVLGTLNVLECCRSRGIGKIVLASTSSVYGDGPLPFREDQPVDRPRSPYAASKRSAELLASTYHELHGVDVTILRYFTVYGPAGRPDMSYFRFIRWLVEGMPILLHGDGSQERDFTYVDDIVDGTLRGLQSRGHEIVNLGGSRPIPLKTLVALLEGIVGRRAEIRQMPSHPADMAATAADVTKARHLLGWEPKVALEAGLENAVRWYREQRDWASRIPLGQ